jgi:hypothetical protein
MGGGLIQCSCATASVHAGPVASLRTSLPNLAALDPIGLHACPTTRLAGLGVGPLERKAESRPV